jgi:hypothetical protein
MASRRDNVILLPGPGGEVSRQLPHIDILRTVVRQLDQLGARLRDLSPQSTWPARRWMIASTPLRMALTIGRHGLRDLAMVCATGDQAHEGWALELSAARREAERWLADMAASLHVLQRADASPIERERQTELLVSARSELLEVLTEIQYMVVRRLPAEPDPS